MSDRILVKGLQVVARHGLLAEEAVLGQRFEIDVEAGLDLAPAGRTDDLRLSVSYADIVAIASETLTTRRFKLLEAAADAVAAAILDACPLVDRVAIELRKPGAPIDAIFAHVAVAIERSRA